MTFPTAKHNNLKNQTGVSLLLAVLILAAVTAIAFSVATIIFIEIRTAGDNLRTEPNLYATLGVTEEALFQYKRGFDPQSSNDFNVTECKPDNEDVCLINNVTLDMPGTQPLEFDNSPRVEFVEASSELTIPMYRINSYDKEYEEIDMQVFPNATDATLEGYFLMTDRNGNKQCNPGGNIPPCTQTFTVPLYPASSYQFTGFTGSGTVGANDGDNFELHLMNTDESQDLSVSIITRRVGDEEPAGLPFTAKKVLRIVADYLGLTRTYQVEIPVP